MMTERAKLNFDDDDFAAPPPAPVPVEQIKMVTRKAGFHETPKASVPLDEQQERRRRRKTGRVHQFATRLRAETIEGFHAYADRHEITIAETLELAQKALLASEKASS